jgi:hypothetical protein
MNCSLPSTEISSSVSRQSDTKAGHTMARFFIPFYQLFPMFRQYKVLSIYLFPALTGKKQWFFFRKIQFIDHQLRCFITLMAITELVLGLSSLEQQSLRLQVLVGSVLYMCLSGTPW